MGKYFHLKSSVVCMNAKMFWNRSESTMLVCLF